MMDISREESDGMAALNNAIVELIDECRVSPSGVVMVLMMVQDMIIQAFEARIKEVK